MNRNVISGLLKSVILIIIASSIFSCKKSDPAPTLSPPAVITNSAAWPGRQWAVLKAQVNGHNQITTVTFQYDTTKNYTHTVSPEPDTTSGNAYVNFLFTLTNLKPNTQYYYRVNAVNATGEAKGLDVAFYTTDTTDIVINFNPDLVYDSIYDSEGNKYRTIVIGTQTWTAENLRSTKLNDGTEIPFVPDGNGWASLTTPGYCWFNNDSVGYGAIYNWYAVATAKLCPEGWHVPTDDEWTILTDYLGGKSIAGGMLKETGTSHWQSPNTDATNGSGFTGLPTGYRNYGGGFNSIGNYGFWWTATEWSSTGAWYRDVFYGYNSVDRSNTIKRSGATIRCIKD
jgi:uncharacterized protein (TIGR02145 family)